MKEVRSVSVRGSTMTTAGMYDASYSATNEMTFDPALDVWSFPLHANETWNATSNATVHGWITWHLSGPKGSWTDVANFTFSEPVRLFLMSGEAMDVSTPAGTFPPIPVWMGRPGIDLAAAGITTRTVAHTIWLAPEGTRARHHSM